MKRLHCRRRVCFLLSLNMNSASAPFFVLCRSPSFKRYLCNAVRRVKQIWPLTIKINLCSSEKSLRNFCFRPHRIRRVPTLIEFNNEFAARYRYRCDSVTVCCIAVRCLASSSFWHDLEFTFGPHGDAQIKSFYEAPKRLLIKHGNIFRTLCKY